MTMLVDLREKIKRLYGQYGVYVQIAAKFLLALAILLFIGAALPFNAVLGNIFVQLILALICSIIPLQGIALVGCLAVVGQCFSLSAEVGVLAVILLLAVLLLYFRITPKDSLALVLTPLAFGIGIPAAVPMGFGLVGGIGSCLFFRLRSDFLYLYSCDPDASGRTAESGTGDVEAVQDYSGFYDERR